MNIKKELNLSANEYFERTESLSEGFLHISHYTLLDGVPEILSEWWSSTLKDMNSFLKDEGLSEVIDDKTFTDILIGKYHFSNAFLLFIHEKLPCKIKIETLYRYNKLFMKQHPNAQRLKTDDEAIRDILRRNFARKRQKRKQDIREWHLTHKERSLIAAKKYRITHQEQIKQSKKLYRETHKEQIRAYKISRREISNEQERKRYRADIEKNRELDRKYRKKYYAENREKILERQAKYRLAHRDEINERFAKRMENEQYRSKIRARQRASYHRNAAEIQERRKQQKLQNLEQVRAKDKIYGKTYREKHREEIRARNRASYQENLVENRKKSAEKQRKYQAKKRFVTKTGPIIMPLLEAIIAQKNQGNQ